MPRKLYPRFSLDKGWVGPIIGLDAVAKRKVIYLCRESKPGRPDRSLISILTDLSYYLAVIELIKYEIFAKYFYMKSRRSRVLLQNLFLSQSRNFPPFVEIKVH
jgi:hypothetical protein